VAARLLLHGCHGCWPLAACARAGRVSGAEANTAQSIIMQTEISCGWLLTRSAGSVSCLISLTM
jgi:hypothetical protein